MHASYRRAAALALGFCCWAGAGFAQTANNNGFGVLSAPAIPAPPADSSADHLFGDWNGLRPKLASFGVDITLDATAEFAGNVSGGLKQGATSANQVAFTLDVDWGKLAGVTGFATHMTIVNRSGGNDSHLFGDNLQPVQEIYGAGGNVVAHLVSVYGEQKLMDGRLDIAAGWMPVGDDFASSPLYCNFMNNGLCGNPKDLPGGDIGFSAYPDATLGARALIRPLPQFSLQAGIYQANQTLYTYPAYRSGFRFDTSKDNGAEIPLEAAWEPSFGAEALPGHYKLGVGIDTTPMKDLSTDVNGGALVATGLPARTRNGQVQFWLLADQMLFRNGPGEGDGLIAFAGYVHSDPDVSVYGDEAFAGLLDKDFWQARPQDSIGLLFIYQDVSNDVTRNEALQQSLGLPFAGGITGVQRREETFEANYDIHLWRGVTFEPDFQYVIHPNAQANIANAAVFGFKMNVNF